MKTHLACFPIIAMAVALAVPGTSHGQAAPTDLNKLVHEMAERVRHLGEDISSDLGQTPAGRHLIQDTQELAQAVDEFHETLHKSGDASQNRQAFAGIESTWQHLRGQFARGSSPAVLRAAERVDQLDAQIRQFLGLNAPPAGFYGGGQQAPMGIADTQRLAHALVERANSLAVVIQADMGRDPNGAALLRDATELARLADEFHDSIDANQSVEVAARAFGPVDTIADRLERYLTANQGPPRVQTAWQAFASVEVLIHRNLGLNSPQPGLQVSLDPQAGGVPPIVGLSNQLVAQVNVYIAAFGPTAGAVPEGGAMLVDAQRLQDAAGDFQRDAARGLAPNQLAYEFRDVDAHWQRLARRVNRIARGRQGPNIDRVQQIGQTCEQVHRVLGMPGYPPSIGGPVGFNPDR